MQPCFPLCALLPSALLLATSVAAANGRFPESNQVVFDPTRPEHLLVRTTFGLLQSRDAGASFSWTCEAAFGVSGEIDPMLAITASGAIVASTYDGIQRSADGCSYQAPPELASELIPDLTLDPRDARRLLAFRTLSVGAGMFESWLLRSEDEGRTWARLDPPLPSTVLPLSVDLAASDPARVYVSGRLGVASRYTSVLLRSDDGGLSFEQLDLPDTDDQRLAFIAAVDPADADHVFVRIDDPAGTRVTASSDGGRSFREIFRGSGRLPGFAIHGPTRQLAVGGPSDGVWVGTLDEAGFEQRSTVAPSCLGYGPDGLYACSDAKDVGTLLSRSRDGGFTFETLLRFDALCGPTACGASTDVGRTCRPEWEFIAPTLGSSCKPGPEPGIAAFRASGSCSTARERAGSLPAAALSALALAVTRWRVRRRRKSPYPHP